MTDKDFDRLRFDEPLYTVGEAARMLRVPPSTFSTWAHGYTRRPPARRPTVAEPVITAFPSDRRHNPEIPFVGLVEGMVAASFRAAGVSMQHIRKALPILESEMGIDHALASNGLRTDGAEILFDYAATDPELDEALTVVVSSQRVFVPVVEDYLTRIEFDNDQWARRLILPGTKRRILEVDPTRAFGQPVFVNGGARVEDVLDRFRAGEALDAVARDFGVEPADLEDVLRATIPKAA
jgi:uncharacterized protein (DUF433 family)